MLGLPKELKRAKASIMIHTIWNVWKERNRRVFSRSGDFTNAGAGIDKG
ncbi:hypothetical protein HU200_043520 [Digitaria exilis]|uniref:Uncharacterized protein n=1 Tax=Digitaria exilis TaxID=1010633 RepID=A0A835EG83_9POAL|nr:hypothetical protein HU200_043520 [Digitaria exilis]